MPYASLPLPAIVGAFQKTREIILEPTTEPFDLERDIAKFLPTKAEGGVIAMRNDAIVERCTHPLIAARKTRLESGVYCFINDITHRAVMTEAMRLALYRRYSIRDAVMLAARLIALGEFETPGKRVFIHLDKRYSDRLSRLDVSCLEKDVIRVDTCFVTLDFILPAGFGICLDKTA